MLANEVLSTQGIFALRIFINANNQKYVGILKGEKIGMSVTGNSRAHLSTMTECTYKRYEVLSETLDELYNDVIEYINSVAGKCINMCEVECR